MSELTYENILEQLVKAIPEANNIYQRHREFMEMDETDPELPRHPVFGELAFFCIRMCMNPSEFERSDEILNRLFAFVEAAANSSDEEVVNLVRVTFLEILSRTDNPCFIIFWHKTLEDYETLTGRTIPRNGFRSQTAKGHR